MTAEDFKEKVMPHHGLMWRTAVVMLRDSDTAKDVVQDALTSLWEKRTSLPDDADSLRGYCIRAVRNKAIDCLRRNQLLATSPIDAVAEPVEARTADPCEEMASRNGVELLSKLVDSLPDNQKTVARMSIFNELDNDEISEATGFSHDNVRALLSRARRRLRELYAKYEFTGYETN